MSEYTISVSQEVATLSEIHGDIRRPLLIVGIPRDIDTLHLIDEGSIAGENYQRYDPTDAFWEKLLEASNHALEVAETIRHVNLPDGGVPDTKHWGYINFRDIPKYEAKLLFEYQEVIAQYSVKTGSLSIFEDTPSLGRLYKEAHIQRGETVPYYLKDL